MRFKIGKVEGCLSDKVVFHYEVFKIRQLIINTLFFCHHLRKPLENCWLIYFVSHFAVFKVINKFLKPLC